MTLEINKFANMNLYILIYKYDKFIEILKSARVE